MVKTLENSLFHKHIENIVKNRDKPTNKNNLNKKRRELHRDLGNIPTYSLWESQKQRRKNSRKDLKKQ
jgi:hypothetical protein